MPQTSYSLDRTSAVAGQVVESTRVVGRYQAAEEIPPGRFVVLNTDGKLELPQDASLSKVVGVAMYRSAKAPEAWQVDDYVPVLRAGVIWCEASGGSPSDLASLNLHHSSTVATNRGKVTASATSDSAGSEISDPGPVTCAQADDVPSGLLLVELAFPGADSDDDTRLDALEAIQIQKASVTVAYDHASFAASGVDGADVDINVGDALPAGAVLLGARYTIATPFAGAGVATLTMMVGFSGDTNGCIEAVDIFGDSAGEYRGTPGTAMGGPAGSKQLVANFDPDAAAGLDELTAGSVTIDVLYCVI